MENIRVHEQLRRREERDFLTFPRGGKMSNVRRTDTEIGRRRGPHLKLFNHVLRLLLQWLPVCKQRCKDAANVWCGGWVDGKECAASVSCDVLVCRRRQTISHWMPGVNMQARVSLMRPGKGIWTRPSFDLSHSNIFPKTSRWVLRKHTTRAPRMHVRLASTPLYR